jgi:hypothetical protein
MIIVGIENGSKVTFSIFLALKTAQKRRFFLPREQVSRRLNAMTVHIAYIDWNRRLDMQPAETRLFIKL